MFLRTALTCALATLAFGATAHADDAPAFTFQDEAGGHLDVRLGDKVVCRYQYAYDKSTPARLAETFKPYLHVFDADGRMPITKGSGGLYTHHRGIFIGWMKITHNGKTYDRWHMKGGEIVHQKFLERDAGKDGASFTSLTHWNDADGKPFLEERRTMAVRRTAAPWRLLIDFTSSLKALDGDVKLDGDPEHAGIQFRPANEVELKETTYVFPKEGAKPHVDLDYPWVGETFTLKGKRHGVVELNHPDNPKKTRWSAYRDYGRFGAFPVAEIPSGKTLVLKYRFLVADGDVPAAAAVQKAWDEFAGVPTPSPVPKTEILPAERPAPPPPKKPAP